MKESLVVHSLGYANSFAELLKFLSLKHNIIHNVRLTVTKELNVIL